VLRATLEGLWRLLQAAAADPAKRAKDLLRPSIGGKAFPELRTGEARAIFESAPAPENLNSSQEKRKQ